VVIFSAFQLGLRVWIDGIDVNQLFSLLLFYFPLPSLCELLPGTTLFMVGVDEVPRERSFPTGIACRYNPIIPTLFCRTARNAILRDFSRRNHIILYPTYTYKRLNITMMQLLIFIITSVCLSAGISQNLFVQTSPNLRCMSPMPVARSSSGSDARRYVIDDLFSHNRRGKCGANRAFSQSDLPRGST